MLVDAHHHLWDLGRFPYPWLSKEAPPRPFGDHSGIKRNFLPTDYRSATRGLSIEKTVHIEAAHGAADPAAESIWLSEVARVERMPNASIAHLDPAAPDVSSALDSICVVPGVRGVRAGIAWRKNSPWRFADRGEISRTSQFRAGIAQVARRGLILELILLPEQLAELAELADAFPEMPIVANHLATLQPEIPDILTVWTEGIGLVAARPNTYIKISGLWTIARDWNRARLMDPIRRAVGAFGPTRSMWGSNLPVEGLMCGAPSQIDILNDILAHYTEYDRAEIFGGAATRLYSLGGDP